MRTNLEGIPEAVIVGWEGNCTELSGERLADFARKLTKLHTKRLCAVCSGFAFSLLAAFFAAIICRKKFWDESGNGELAVLLVLGIVLSAIAVFIFWEWNEKLVTEITGREAILNKFFEFLTKLDPVNEERIMPWSLTAESLKARLSLFARYLLVAEMNAELMSGPKYGGEALEFANKELELWRQGFEELLADVRIAAVCGELDVNAIRGDAAERNTVCGHPPLLDFKQATRSESCIH